MKKEVSITHTASLSKCVILKILRKIFLMVGLYMRQDSSLILLLTSCLLN